MDKKKYWIIRLFFVLFSMSVSFAILPCGIINVHGLFGEIITSVATEDEAREISDFRLKDIEKVQTIKGINIFNIWFEILMTIICIVFCANLAKLPRGDTIVTLRVRMDN